MTVLKATTNCLPVFVQAARFDNAIRRDVAMERRSSAKQFLPCISFNLSTSDLTCSAKGIRVDVFRSQALAIRDGPLDSKVMAADLQPNVMQQNSHRELGPLRLLV